MTPTQIKSIAEKLTQYSYSNISEYGNNPLWNKETTQKLISSAITEALEQRDKEIVEGLPGDYDIVTMALSNPIGNYERGLSDMRDKIKESLTIKK